MPTQIQWRRGNTAQTAAFTGAIAEVTVDTEKNTIVVHDGVTPGGYALAKESGQQDALAFDTANAAFAKANNEAGVNATQNTNITNAQNTGDAAFIRANNSLNANTGGEISGNLLPTTTNTYYLGSDAKRWHSLYVGPGSIDLGGLVLSNQNGSLSVSVGGQPPTQISGSDQVARDTANAAFASANNIDGINTTQNTNITVAQLTATAAFLAANNVAPQIEPAFTTANGAFAAANNEAGVNATQNTNITNAQNTADAGFIHANAAFAKANNEAGVNATQNTNITIVQNTAQAAFEAANAAGSSALVQYASNHANGAFIAANTADDKGTSAGIYANGSFAKANNEAGVNVTQNTNITTAQNTGDAAFIRANNSLDANNGGTITGDLSISGNLSVLGNTFTVSATTIVANDTVLVLGSGNYTSDLLDIGISAHYNDGVNAHTGLIRDHGTKEWQLFEGYTGEIGANNDVNINDPSFKRATLNANLKSQLITLNSQDLQTYIDNAFAKANNEAGVNATQNTNITTAQNTGDAAFAAANNEAGVNATQNTNITFAWNHANSVYNYANTLNPSDTFARDTANAAFITANTANNTANIAYRSSWDVHGKFKFEGFSFGGGYYALRIPSIDPGTNTPAIFVEAGKTYAFDIGPLRGMTGVGIFTRPSYFGDSSYVANVTHVSPTGVVTSNVSSSKSSGTLYWTVPWALIGNTTISIADPVYNGTQMTVRIINPGLILDASTKANASFTSANGTIAWNSANGAFIAANSAGVYANGAFVAANSAGVYANGAFAKANNEAGVNTTQNTNISLAWNHANSAFAVANNAGADSYARNTANAAFERANNGTTVVELWGWGDGALGKLGLNGGAYATTDRSSPVLITTSVGGWKALSIGDQYYVGAGAVCMLKTDGSMWHIGGNNFAGGGDFYKSSPTQLGAGNTWLQVSSSTSFMAAINANSGLWVAGSGTDGKLGQNNADFKTTLTPVAGSWKFTATGYDHMHGIKSDGTLWSWGNNPYGQLGVGDAIARSSPTQVGAATTWKYISAGYQCFHAIKTDGTLWACGYQNDGSLGVGAPTQTYSAPVQVGSGTNWRYVFSSGFRNGAGIKTDGTLWMWGSQYYGTMGNGSTLNLTNISSPTQVGSGTDWKTVSIANMSVVALKTDGIAYGWGLNSGGHMSNNLPAGNYASPVQISVNTGAYEEWADIRFAGGTFTVFGIKKKNIVPNFTLRTAVDELS